MARNEEKAQSMLNRFLDSKKKELGEPKKKRPYLATECRDLNEADKWRQQILRDVGKKVMEIQNAALGEHRLRDLNDEINKLLREKGHWEKRIVELGGPNYAKVKSKETEGHEIADATGKGEGYRYFGAAKSLPGVKELFEKQAPRAVRRNRHEIYKHINGDYYGFRDEEDGVLIKLEGPAEKKLRAQAVEDWEKQEIEREQAKATVSATKGDGCSGADAPAESDEPQFVAYVPLPDKAEIEKAVVAKKKKDLLLKYASAELMAKEQEAKAMLNKK